MNQYITRECPICGRQETVSLALGFVPAHHLTCTHDGVIWQMNPVDAEWAKSVKMYENDCGWVDALGGWHEHEGSWIDEQGLWHKKGRR